MRIHLECIYCGHIWDRLIYSEDQISKIKCIKCGDRKLKVKDYKDNKLDSYIGCPPFPEKEIKPLEFKELDTNVFVNLDEMVISAREDEPHE